MHINGIFPETTQRLADHGVALHHLCTWWDVLAEARAQGAFDDATLAEFAGLSSDVAASSPQALLSNASSQAR